MACAAAGLPQLVHAGLQRKLITALAQRLSGCVVPGQAVIPLWDVATRPDAEKLEILKQIDLHDAQRSAQRRMWPPVG